MSDSQHHKKGGAIAWMAANPIAANLLMLFVFVAGLAALMDIRKEVFPSFSTETFTVTVPYPGSSPEEVEQGIVLKIEEALRDIVGVKEIRSVAREGVGVVTVQMEVGTDINSALNQAKVRVDGIAAFPLDAEEPIVEEVVWRGAAMRISLYGDVDTRSLKELAEQVREEVLQLDDISEVNFLGDREYEISIEVSDARLRSLGIDFDQVVSAIRNQSRDLPGGLMRTTEGSITLRSVSQAYNSEDFAELDIINRADGTQIRLGEVATIRDGFSDQPVLTTFNGQEAITLLIDRVGDQSVLKITEQVKEYVEQKRGSLSHGLQIEGWNDRSVLLKGRIELLLKNAGQGALLVIIALALFLNASLALWVIIGVPFAMLGSLAFIQFVGIPVTINVLSVFSFILVLGILVDDGIVTAESAYAQIERDGQGADSVVSGVHRVAIATIFGALTTMIAFSPTLFLEEGFARVLTQMGPVVILCLLFSLIETKLILPAHLRHIKVGGIPPEGWRGALQSLQRRLSTVMSQFATGPYARFLAIAVRRRYLTLSVFIGVLIISLSLIPSGIVRFVFFPNVASDNIILSLEMPQGTAWQKTHQFAKRVEAAVLEMDERFKQQDAEARTVVKNLLVVSESDTTAKVHVELLSSEYRDISSVILAQWFREALGTLEGVRSLSIDANAGPGGTALEIQLRGKNLESLRSASEFVKRELLDIGGVQDVRDSFAAGGLELDIHATPEGESLGLGQC